MIPEHEKVYEEELRSLILAYREEEEYNRSKRQNLEAKLKAFLDKRGAARPKSGCPSDFTDSCVLEDGTRCPFYHNGVCDLTVFTEVRA